MKYRFLCTTAATLLLLISVLSACRETDSLAATDSSATSDTSAASNTAGISDTDRETGSDQSETATEGVEPTTDAVYPDGETNPDWPYSPGV